MIFQPLLLKIELVFQEPKDLHDIIILFVPIKLDSILVAFLPFLPLGNVKIVVNSREPILLQYFLTYHSLSKLICNYLKSQFSPSHPVSRPTIISLILYSISHINLSPNLYLKLNDLSIR